MTCPFLSHAASVEEEELADAEQTRGMEPAREEGSESLERLQQEVARCERDLLSQVLFTAVPCGLFS